MEMVSTAKSKRMIDRVKAAKPYGMKIAEIINSLSDQRESTDSPLMRSLEHPKAVALLVVTANRGLCGAYNTNILKMTRNRIEDYRKRGIDVKVYVVGKKGIGFFRFIKFSLQAKYDTVDDALKFSTAEAIAYDLMNAFVNHEVDRVEIVSTVYHGSSRQTAEVTQLLPLGSASGDAKKGGKSVNAIYEPQPDIILKKLLPLMIKTTLFRLLLEALAAEHIYRRVAMKSATDSAGQMVKMLVRNYNRVRQASITQELSEIVAGADAIS